MRVPSLLPTFPGAVGLRQFKAQAKAFLNEKSVFLIRLMQLSNGLVVQSVFGRQ